MNSYFLMQKSSTFLDFFFSKRFAREERFHLVDGSGKLFLTKETNIKNNNVKLSERRKASFQKAKSE